MNRQILLIFLCSILHIPETLRGQVYFSGQLAEYGSGDFLGIAEATSDCGFIVPYYSDTLPSGIAKVTSTGAVQWARSGFNTAAVVRNWVSGGFVVADYNGSSRLVWLNAGGSVVRGGTLNTPNAIKFLEVFPNGNLLAGGDTWIYLCDSNGIQLSAIRYLNAKVTSLVAMRNGNATVLLQDLASGVPAKTNVYCYNQAGVMQWNRGLALGGGSSTGYDWGVCITESADGQLLIGGMAGSWTTFYSGNCPAFVLKLSASGNYLWRKLIPSAVNPNWSARVNQITATADGGGFASFFNGGIMTFPNNANENLIRFDGGGNGLFSIDNFVPGGPANGLFGIQSLRACPDGSVMWTAYYDADGNSTTGVYNFTALFGKIAPAATPACRASLPWNGFVNVSTNNSGGFFLSSVAASYVLTNQAFTFPVANPSFVIACTGCTAPTSNFSFIQSGLTISFSESAGGECSYLWDFGDGSTSTSANPAHTYSTGANPLQNVCLTVTNGCGSHSFCQQINLCSPSPAAFSLPAMACTGQIISFTDQSLGAISWNWLDDGTPFSSAQNPTYSFVTTGNHQVTLITDNGPCNDTVVHSIPVVSSVPVPAFTVSQAGNTWQFTNASLNATSYFWTFGDGGTSTLIHPTHTYPSVDTFTVCLVATNPCGSDTFCLTRFCDPPRSNFKVSTLGGTVTFTNLSQNATAWHWNFGDLSTSTLQNPPPHFYPVGSIGNPLTTLTSQNACATDTFRSEALISQFNNAFYYTMEVKPTAGSPRGSVQTPDGGFVVWYDSSIAKFDGGGNQNWSRGFAPFANNKIKSVIPVSTGGYLVAGLMSGDRMFMMKTNATGIPLWKKEFSNVNFTCQVMETPTGFVIAGATGTLIGTSLYGYPFILQTDFTGNLLWQKYIPSPSLPVTDLFLRKGPSSTLVLAIKSNSGLANAFFKFNNTGTLLLQKQSAGINPIKDFQVLSDGRLAMVHDMGFALATFFTDVNYNTGLNLGIRHATNFTGNPTFAESMTLIGGAIWESGNRAGSAPYFSEIVRMSTAGTVQLSKLLDFPTGYTRIQMAMDGSPWLVSLNPASGVKVMKTDFGVSSPCTTLTGDASTVLSGPSMVSSSFTPGTFTAISSSALPTHYETRSPTFFTCVSSCAAPAASFSVSTVSTYTRNFSAPAGGAYYSWDFGDGTTGTGQNLNHTFPSSSGIYQVCLTVSGACGNGFACQAVLICSPATTNFITPSSPQICPGNSIALVGGSFNSYLWSTGSTSQSFTATALGNYSVTATDHFGCTHADTATVSLSGGGSLPALGPDFVLCPGSSATLNPGAGFVTYNWSTGATASAISINAAGTYAVTVTTSGGCTIADTVLVTLGANPVVNLGPDLSFCAGGNATLDAGAGFSSYLWTGGATTQTLAVTNSGTYSVTVTNANNCTASDAVIVTVHANPVVNLGPDLSFCAGDSASLDAGAGFSSYLWTGGATTQTLAVNSSGTYSVTVTNGNNCTAQDSVNVTLHANPVVNLGPDLSFCAGDSASLDAGAGFASYLWTGGATTQTLAVNSSGTYSVTVTNGNNCTAQDSVNVTVHANPAVNLGPDLSFCAGGNATLDAGTGFSSYLWTGGATAQTLAVNSSGSFSVTVTNANNCTASDTLNVTVHAIPVVNLGPDLSFCAGDSASLDAGAGFASYLWSGGATTQMLTVNGSGTFSVTVTNANNCTASDSVVVFILPQPLASFSFTTNNTTVSFTDLSSGTYSGWFWDFGDGQYSSQQNPVHTYSSGGPLTVCLTVSGACDSASHCLTINLTEREMQRSVEPLSVHPNPSEGLFIVTFDTPIPFAGTVEVYNATGQKVIAEWIQAPAGQVEWQIDLRGQSSGIYLLSFTGEGLAFTARLVVQ